jgi:hypothetical protein
MLAYGEKGGSAAVGLARPALAAGPGWARASLRLGRSGPGRAYGLGPGRIENVFFEIFSCAKINPEISR